MRSGGSWQGGSEECESETGPIPCDESRVIDCAMLRHVSLEAEVQAFLATLRA